MTAMLVLDSGYTLKSEYINARTKVEIECPEGHIFNITPSNYKSGSRCKQCFKKRQQQRMMGNVINSQDTSTHDNIMTNLGQSHDNIMTPEVTESVVNSPVEQCDSNVTTPIEVNESVVNQVNTNLQQATPITDNTLYNTYIKFFVKLKKDGVVKVTPSNENRQFTLDCRGSILDIHVLDTIHDKHPDGIYPIYLDCSVYKTDEEYIKDWIMSVIRGGE